MLFDTVYTIWLVAAGMVGCIEVGLMLALIITGIVKLIKKLKEKKK